MWRAEVIGGPYGGEAWPVDLYVLENGNTRVARTVSKPNPTGKGYVRYVLKGVNRSGDVSSAWWEVCGAPHTVP